MPHFDEPRLPVRIEAATVDDAEAILTLQRRAYQSEAALYEDWSIPPLTEALDDLRGEFPDTIVLKAISKKALVGSIRGNAQDGTCTIRRLSVKPELQGHGIGSLLVQALEDLFPAVARFELYTGARSAANIRLYERLGYRLFRTQVYSDSVTLAFMEKSNVAYRG